MAGVSPKEIKSRIRSMESTRQITQAMDMVAASKLRKAQTRVLASRPYFERLYATVNQMADTNSELSSPYLTKREGNRVCYVVIAGDRGLAGGYNSNVFKLVMAELEGKDATVVPIGRKAVDFFASRGAQVLTVGYTQAGQMTIGDCFSLSRQLCKGYLCGEFDEIHVAYSNFVTVLTQSAGTLRLLPLLRQKSGKKGNTSSDILYEPGCAEVFDAIIPEYLGGVLYGALCESLASEQAARRTAMDSATQNACQMIDSLRLEFNRARQAAITQEITEIIAGASFHTRS